MVVKMVLLMVDGGESGCENGGDYGGKGCKVE